jgi:hypothetical protein
MPFTASRLKEQTSTIDISAARDLEMLSAILFDYSIFPLEIMSHLCEWTHKKREMRIGDTIVQQVFLPPLKSFSLKVIFGVCITDIIKESSRVGFSYQTLQGHVERGVSTFTLEQTAQPPCSSLFTHFLRRVPF